MDLYFGWIENPWEVDRILSTLPEPIAVTQAIKDTEHRDVFAWELEQSILGKILPAPQQGNVGTCVSFGWAGASQDSLLYQVATGQSEWPGCEIATEPIYGGSRVEVGGGRLRGDGSVGAWAAKWCSLTGGLLLRKIYQTNNIHKNIDLTKYSEQRSRDWGYSGVPDHLEPLARVNPVTNVSLIENVEQCVDLLKNYYFGAICGQQGRTMKRQPGGWCRVQGSWAHCQRFRGYCLVKSPNGGTPAIVIGNSWGDYLGTENNIVTLESGREVILPSGCYLSRLEEVQSDLRLRDTFVAGSIGGFKPQNPWFVH